MRLVSRSPRSGGLAGFFALAVLLSTGCGPGTGGDDDDGTPSTGNADQDGDGFTASAGDCDDTNAAVNIGAPELCDGVDNDCDGDVDENADADGDGGLSAALCDGGTDCNDNDPAIYAGATEACDGKDNNCDGNIDETFDTDGDGQASAQTCGAGTDCDDSNAAVYLGADELCDTLDNDCDGTADEGFDQDGDGYTSANLCDSGTDCNDSDPTINPGAQEILDGKDNDCAGGIEQSRFDLNYADLRLNPPAGYTLINSSVAAVGDVNGDGYDDAVVGLPKKTSDPQYRGAAYLVFGRDLGNAPVIENTDVSGLLLTGVDNGEGAGLATTRVGDLNGDGIEDLVIAGPKSKNGAIITNAGSVYILWGKTAGWSNGQALNTANLVIHGTYTGQEFGSSIAGVGDVNGDGIDDLLVGAQSSLANPSTREGRAYVFYGRRSGWENITSSDAADASFLGESPNSFTGGFVGAAGDVNGDGLNDLIIGAPGSSEGGPGSGKTYLIFGANNPSWGTDFSLSRANVKLNGAPDDGAVSVGSVTLIPSAGGVGDVDGDGYDDVVITAPEAKGGGASLVNNGKAYLIYGRDTAQWTGSTTLTEASGAIFYGEASGDQLGSDFSGLGDVNGDGYDDFMVSAPGSDAGVAGSNAGQTYVLLGTNNRASFGGGLFASTVSFLGGVTGKVGTGISLAGSCDFNADGTLDFLIASTDGTLFVVTDFAY